MYGYEKDFVNDTDEDVGHYNNEEEEYDNSFIDDESIDNNLDVKKELRRLTGYDPTKFTDREDDLSDMEARYDDIEDEEQIASKIAQLED